MKVVLDEFILVMLGVAPMKKLKKTISELPGMAVQSNSTAVIFTALTQMWRTVQKLMKCLWDQLRQVGITLATKAAIPALQISFLDNS